MAAPTPVSALVHSSTLVTAGLYVLFRCGKIKKTRLICFGFLTIFIGGVAGIVEKDLKKLIAYSTLRQLGLMLFFFYLTNKKIILFVYILVHAVFKALLFICGGYILLYSNHSQDFRLMGKKNKKPLIDISLLVSLFRLRGFPFLSGFLVKDSVILRKGCFTMFLVLVIFMRMFIREFYSFRIIFFLYEKNNQKKKFTFKNEYSIISFLPLYILMFVSSIIVIKNF